MDAADPSSTRRQTPFKPFWVLAAVVAACLLIGIAVRVVWNRPVREPDPRPPAKLTLDVAETIRLESLKAEAIALLESLRIEEAEANFRTIAQTLPNDEVVARNIAIGRILRLDTDKSDEALALAGEAVDKLTTAHPESAIGHWLKARRLETVHLIAAIDDQESVRSSQLSSLETAAQRDPKSAVYPYAIYRVAKDDATDDALADRGRTALLQALQLEPDNIFLLIEALEVLRVREDAAFGEVATRLMKLLEPLRDGLARKVKTSNPFDVLDQARKAAEEKQWKPIMRHLISIGWIKSDDVAQSDRRRIDPHPLEFVARQFSSAEPASLPAVAASKSAVRFQSSPVTLAGTDNGSVADVAWGDADLDDVTDLWVLAKSSAAGGGSHLGVYERTADANEWKMFAGVDFPAQTSRLLLADLDRDDKDLQKPRPGHPLPPSKVGIKEADLDAVCYGVGGIRIIRCDADAESGERSFTVIDQPGGLDALTRVTAAALGDFDHDGDLDLCVGADGSLQIWINRGNGLFDSVSQWSMLPKPGEDFTSIVAVDMDRDVDIDLVAVGPGLERVGMLENLRHLNFRWRELDDIPRYETGFADLRVIEADGNGSWDLALVGAQGIQLSLSDTPAAGVLQLRSANLLANDEASRVLAGDFDNDGYQDLLAYAADPAQMFRGLAHGTFASGQPLLDSGPSNLLAADAGDFDRDGDLDLIGVTADGLVLFTNELAGNSTWIDVEVRGIEEAISGRVNFLGLGSVVEVRSPSGRYQAQLVQGAVTHFGLGQDERAEVARVLFTNGIPQTMIRPAPRQLVRETQKQIGSCPYCYVWNGREYEFATDLLWAAPIGLITAEGQVMPDRPWEYLKLDGDRLAPRDGHYELLLTEELWEAGYFDEVELLAVDHPADIEVYSNEKVGPPDLAKFQIHTVRQRRLPVAARDSAGRDVLPELRARDNQFAQCFEKTFRQGLAETHYLELDLGPLERAQRITLFLTGWIRPTDTSLNLALSQDSRFQGPRPPRILVPGENGTWREAVPFMGFPGGKTKTIAVDLSGVLAAPDSRLRIETSAELRWDEAFFTVDEEPVECQVRKLTLQSADLRYGGFSRRIEPRGGEPDTFDRSHRDLAPQWPPMRGCFTRFGDVRELLETTDDRLAIIGAGDEIVVRFVAPPPPPPGWKRDFILHNVGWDKDCVLNTVLGQTVEPLPFQAMPSYPYAAADYPDSPALRAYLREYQTRRQPFHEFWRQLSAPPRK